MPAADLQRVSLAIAAEPGERAAVLASAAQPRAQRVAQLRSLKPAPMPHAVPAAPAAREGAQLAANGRHRTTLLYDVPLFFRARLYTK